MSKKIIAFQHLSLTASEHSKLQEMDRNIGIHPTSAGSLVHLVDNIDGYITTINTNLNDINDTSVESDSAKKTIERTIQSIRTDLESLSKVIIRNNEIATLQKEKEALTTLQKKIQEYEQYITKTWQKIATKSNEETSLLKDDASVSNELSTPIPIDTDTLNESPVVKETASPFSNPDDQDQMLPSTHNTNSETINGPGTTTSTDTITDTDTDTDTDTLNESSVDEDTASTRTSDDHNQQNQDLEGTKQQINNEPTCLSFSSDGLLSENLQQSPAKDIKALEFIIKKHDELMKKSKSLFSIGMRRKAEAIRDAIQDIPIREFEKLGTIAAKEEGYKYKKNFDALERALASHRHFAWMRNPSTKDKIDPHNAAKSYKEYKKIIKDEVPDNDENSESPKSKL